MTARTGHTRRRMTRADREQQLLDVAERTLVELGYAATTMDEVARRAGVTKPLLYDHFGSKDGLIVACIGRVRADVLKTCQEAVATGTSQREMFALGIRAFFDYIAQHQRAWSVLLAEGQLTGPAGEEVEALRRQQAELIARLFPKPRGVRQAARIDTYAQAVVGACERVALWRDGRRHPNPADAAAHIADVFWRGLDDLTG
jgi:AcrR family transcriptional regulator